MRKFDCNGITLIALVISIVVLLILAGVSIATLTGENGILTRTNDAKTQTQIAEEKEAIQLAVANARILGEISKPNLDEELDRRPGSGNYESQVVDEGIAVTFKVGSKKTYLVDNNGNVTEYLEKMREPEPEDSTLATLQTMSYGVIEIEFLSGTGYTVGEANNPSSKLKDGMEAVYWAKDATGVIDTENPANNTYLMTTDEANFNIENWYSYTAQSSTTESGGSSRWANATTTDGSYYVWIPRYAYRIIYFNSPENENAYRAGTLTEEEALANNYIVGYSDARGIVDKVGKRPTSVTSTNDKYFRVHPAFDGNEDEGGWDSKLEGIWIAKYEMSGEKSTDGTTWSEYAPGNVLTTVAGNTSTTPIRLVSKPDVSSWRGINVANMYTNAKAYAETTLGSHLMKNSEWGAVAYLLDSKYGRNGTEISVNQCTGYITGAGRGLKATETDDETITGTSDIYNTTYSTPTDVQKYNGTVGQLSSTTGNIYGIYDMSGGAADYVMGFYGTDTTTPTLENSGFTTTTFPSENKYYQIYAKTASDGKDLGDALYETKNWNGDVSYFIYSSHPVFARGGGLWDVQHAGAYNYAWGDGYSSYRFSRVSCSTVM